MTFYSYTPKPPLSQFVEVIWSMQTAGARPSRQRVYPTGMMELVIHLADRHLSWFDGTHRQSVRVPLLAGPYSRAFMIDPSEYTAVLGVRFKPGALGMFFQLPAHELHNTDVALEDLRPEEAASLHDMLISASSQTGRFQALERYLVNKLPNGRLAHPAVSHAVREFVKRPGVRAIADIQADSGLSHTRFIQVFREHVGLTPKLFCRIQRFRSVLQYIESGLPVNWAEVAASCGYYDQAHLINDFRTFSGITPVTYALAETRSRRQFTEGSTAL